MQFRLAFLVAAAVLTAATTAHAEGPSAEELAKANNPLADIRAFNLQNYYLPSLYDAPDVTANTFWLRGAAPTGRVLWRVSVPFPTLPTAGGSLSGLGDMQLFGAYLISQDPGFSFGVGPQFSFPTASEDELGSGKWQAGLAAVAFAGISPAFQLGGLVLLQTSFAGDDDREDTSALAVQPFAFWQLGGGYYLRAAPIWAFNLESGDYNVPFGLGVGKVMTVDRTVFNLFLEPQFTALHDGGGQPVLQVFTGVNMQFN